MENYIYTMIDGSVELHINGGEKKRVFSNISDALGYAKGCKLELPISNIQQEVEFPNFSVFI